MKPDVSDLLIVTGMAVIVAGLYLIYVPAAVITGGVMLAILGVALAKDR